MIMDRLAYNTKMNDILADNTTYRVVPKNPLPSQIYSFKRLVRPLLPPEVFKKVSVPTPSLPYIYGAPKVHKEGAPLRPVIASCNGVFSLLERWLADFLSQLLGTISRSHLKNSVEFINRASHFDVSGRLMISLDVTSLFSRVPIPKLLDFLASIDFSHLIPIPVPNFISLIDVCMKQNLFSFVDTFHAQVHGASMGGSLSPVLASLYMEFFEDRLLPTIPSFPDIVCWLRFVDDTFIIVERDVDVDGLLTEVNGLEESIQFTVEVESRSALPFLDTLVHRSSPLSFSVYRKPSFAGNLMNAFSYHSHSTKRGVVVGAFLRAFRLSSPSFLDQEFAYLFELFRGLGFPTHFILRCRRLASSIYHSGIHGERDGWAHNKDTIFVPFCSELEKIAWTLKVGLGISIVFTYPCTISSLLIRTSPKDTLLCGVYRIPCSVCNLCYYGETSKSLPTRISQHKYAVRTGMVSSAVFQHQSSVGHCMDFDSAELIYRSADRDVRHFVESIFISGGGCINSAEGFFALDESTRDFATSLLTKK